jgi:hypothetical protein
MPFDAPDDLGLDLRDVHSLLNGIGELDIVRTVRSRGFGRC